MQHHVCAGRNTLMANQQAELIYLHQILYGENWKQFLAMFASENTSNKDMISEKEKL